MRYSTAILPVSILALVACSSETPEADDGEGISMEEAAERVADNDMKPEPGEYQVNVEVLEVSLPGAPQGAEDMIRQQMGDHTSRYCLTQEEVDEGYERMATQSQAGSDCNFSRFDVDGGDLDAEMTCSAGGQGTMTITLDGEGTPTRSVMHMTMQGNMPGAGEMTIRTRATHERMGDCAG